MGIGEAIIGLMGILVVAGGALGLPVWGVYLLVKEAYDFEGALIALVVILAGILCIGGVIAMIESLYSLT